MGSKTPPRHCKFCGRIHPNISFKKDAHVIPAAFGNRRFFSYEECDECNDKGSVIENDLANFLTLERQLSFIPARQGTPKYRHPEKKSFMKSSIEKHALHLHMFEGENELKIKKVDKNKRELSVQLPPYRLTSISKALGRMAIFISSHLENLPIEQTLKWIQGEVSWFPLIFYRVLVPGTACKNAGILIWKATLNGNTPTYLLAFVYSVAILLFYLPDEMGKQPQDPPDIFKLLEFPSSLPGHFVLNRYYIEKDIEVREEIRKIHINHKNECELTPEELKELNY